MPNHKETQTAAAATSEPGETYGMCSLPDAQSSYGNEHIKNQIAAKSAIGTKYSDSTAKGLSVANLARDKALGVAQAAGGLSEHEGKVLGKANKATGLGFSFLGHMFGDERVAESTAGHAANSAVKTGGDFLTSSVGAANPAYAGNPFAQVAAMADGFVDVDNPLKMATSMSTELIPTSAAGKAINGGVDAFTSLGNFAIGDDAAAYQGADVVQENSVNGSYGAVTQSMTYGMAALTGDKETLNKATDQKAKTGERGFFTAWGNAVGDGLMPDESREVTKTNIDQDIEDAKNTHWYTPWRW